MTEDSSRQSNPANTTPPDWDALARFLAGESAPEEAARVEQWLNANPQDRELVHGLNAAIVMEPGRVDVDGALAQVHSRLNEPASEPASQPRLTIDRGRTSGGPTTRPWRGVIAATVLAAAAVIGFVMLQSSRSQPIQTERARTARLYKTAVGQRDSILLADGSRVILGPDSRLAVPADYGKSSRALELQGDGYFDVRHDAATPFSVRIGRAIVEDIGTTFTVESDAGDTTTVAVMSGSVRLRVNGSAATAGEVLAAGDRGSLAAQGDVRAYPHTVTDDAAWTTGRLVFRDASLARVAGELRRWYGVELRIADSSLIHRTVNTSFNGEPIDEVLKIIGLALGVRIDRQGDSATVSLIR
ncbi:MAG: FecR domain-containing protein [bacterium]